MEGHKRRSRIRPNYKEGDWFAVPLPKGGFGLGIIARSNRKGYVLAYFFAGRHEKLPTAANVKDLASHDAIWIAQCGDLGILRGEWPIIASSVNWRSEEWPFPRYFGRIDRDEGRAWLVEYDEKTPLRMRSQIEVSIEQAEGVPSESLYGYVALQIKLEMVIESCARTVCTSTVFT